MTGDRRREIERRLNENRGRRLVAEWSRGLGDACGVEISGSSFLSAERTAAIKEAFFAKLKTEVNMIKMVWEKQAREAVARHLLGLCVNVRTLPIIMFSSVDQFIGSVRLPADCVLGNAMAVWAVVDDDLSMVTEDIQHGLRLEDSFYTPSGTYIREGLYELTAWGRFSLGGKLSTS